MSVLSPILFRRWRGFVFFFFFSRQHVSFEHAPSAISSVGVPRDLPLYFVLDDEV